MHAPHDRGEGHVEDGVVEADQEQADAKDGEDRPSPARRPVCALAKDRYLSCAFR